jgi:phage terminase large subunit-like protein
MSIAVKTIDGKIFVETIDCQSVRNGNMWILQFLQNADVEKVIVDGAGAQNILSDEMKAFKLKLPILPTVKEVVIANAMFKQALDQQTFCHRGQPSLEQSASNCEKRLIGTGGGFGFKSIREDVEIAILDSVILAHWACAVSKEKRKQSISY